MIRHALWRLLFEQGGWSRIWYGLATAMVVVGGGLIYNQTQGGGTPPAGPSGCALPNYPDASCTGVPDGTTLTTTGGMTVNTNDAVVDAMNITGTLTISADNVTVQNSHVHEGILIDNTTTGTLIKDTEIECNEPASDHPKGIAGSSVGDYGSNFRAYRINLHGCEDGCFCGENFQVRDSYFHDPWETATTHNDGFQVEYGGDTVIDHNYVTWVDTSAIAYCTNAGCTIGANVLIRNNLLSGGIWTMYCPTVSTTNYTIIGNRWVDGSWGEGPGADCDGEIQLDNRLQTAGTIVYLNGTPITDCPLPAFPNGTCAGVPAGVSLTSSGSLNITTPGTVINGLDITGSVTVNAPDVIIANSRITNRDFAVIQNNSTNLQVWNSELINLAETGENRCHNGIQENNFLLDKVEITGCENAINIESPGNVHVFGTYIHDLDTVGPSYIWGNDPHTDGVQINGGSANVLFSHTGIDPVGSVIGVGGTSAVIMDVGSDPPHNSDTVIEDSYLDGRNSAYALYAPRVTTSGILINDNKMYSGGVGYTDCVRVGVTVEEFNNNRDAGTDALISPDEGAGQACED